MGSTMRSRCCHATLRRGVERRRGLRHIWPRVRPVGRRPSDEREMADAHTFRDSVHQSSGTLSLVPTTKPRIQVTVDEELEAALRELGGGKSRSRAVHDLALLGAEAMREKQEKKRRAIEHLLRIARGEDDGYDFSVSERLHAER